MHEEVRARGVTFVLVGIPDQMQVHPDVELRAEFLEFLGIPDLDYADRRLARLSRREGIRFIPLTAPMRSHGERHGTHVYGFKNTRLGFGHWNRNGHRLAGAHIARALCANAESTFSSKAR